MNKELLHSLSAVSTVEGFKIWAREVLRPVLPHGALISGLGHLHAGGVGLDYLVTVDFPVTHIEAIRNRAGAIETPILRRWLLTQEPVYFDVKQAWPETSREWLRSFRFHQLENVLAHAVYDSARCVGTYHSLFRIPCEPDRNYVDTLKALVPALHEALYRIIEQARHREPLGTVATALSGRERRVIDWLRLGKTNAEIALLLGLSENTVKHYVTGAFNKLGVSNRAQLVRRLAEVESQQSPGTGTRLL